jgi:CSLREA domain-containing protein
MAEFSKFAATSNAQTTAKMRHLAYEKGLHGIWVPLRLALILKASVNGAGPSFIPSPSMKEQSMRRMTLLTSAVAAAILFASGVLLTPTNDARAEATFVVDSTSDSADVNPGDGACDTDGSAPGNQCTLRAAIQQANAATGTDTIHFGMLGAGVHTIRLHSQLPTLSDATGPTTIDGYTQPGSSPNTASLASNAKIMVQIKGGGHDQFDGLSITSPGNVVRGLAFYKLRTSILLHGNGAHDNRIAGNFIGTDAIGRYHAAELIPYGYASGVKVGNGASNNVIGGAPVADRNVLSGNASHGVGLYSAGTNSNVIVGNVIGLTPSGKGRLANKGIGVDINFDASYNVVGGTLESERNVISGNGREGVEISHHENTSPTANRIIGNFIGTDLTGETGPKYARNGLDGVHLVDGARDSVIANNIIGNSGASGVAIDGSYGSYTSGNKVFANRIGISRGGRAIPNRAAGVRILASAKESQIGPNNIIANNPLGVQVADPYTNSNTITANAIHDNAKLGIDLHPIEKQNKNDAGDADSGANQRQNSPVLTSATSSGGTTTIKGVLNSTPDTTFLIQLFSNPKGTNEGRSFIAQNEVTTASSGKASLVFRFTKAVRPGRTITATATDLDGNTSEFSAPKTVVQR